jgi:hypothetical protein
MFALEDELIFVIGPQINPFRGTIIFTKSNTIVGGSDDVITNGGFGLIDTGEKKLLVTCHHVWNGFLEERKKNSQAKMCVCFHGCPPIFFDKYEPIDQDKTLDITTFDANPVLNACREHNFFSLKASPPPPLVKNDRIILLGDQGMFRSLTNVGLEFGVTTYLVRVSSIDGLRFHADISKVESKYVRQPTRTPKGSLDGGISGSPCFVLRENRIPQFAGFVSGDCLNYLCFTHANCLNPNGTIKKVVC